MERVATGQRLGRRDAQEDAIAVLPLSPEDPNSELLLMLADGMGGHAGGEVASRVAIEQFGKHFTEVSENMRPRARLRESLEAANGALLAEISANEALRGMGCTFVGALVSQGRLIWVSVGDSSLFLLRNGTLKRLNADHSLYGALTAQVARGEITQAEADAHPQRNALRSALAGNPVPLIDANATTLEPGDVVVVASDGLDTLGPQEIARIVQQRYRTGAGAVERALLEAVEARDLPRQDNTSVIVLREAGAPTSGGLGLLAWEIGAEDGRLFPWVVGAAGAAAVLVLAMLAYLLLTGPEPAVEPIVTEMDPALIAPEAEGPARRTTPPETAPIEGAEPVLGEERDALEAQEPEPLEELPVVDPPATEDAAIGAPEVTGDADRVPTGADGEGE